MKKGFMISFEGGEGCGKSTQLKRFEQYLKDKNLSYILSREPGGTPVGEKIRQILLDKNEKLSSTTEFFLFCAGRNKNVLDVILPALEEGKVVVMDRFSDSSYTYQGYAGDIDLQDVVQITKLATGGLEPDMTVLLDLSYESGMARKQKDENLRNLDRFELKDKSYHDKVRAGYLDLAKKNPHRYFVVDASQSPEKVFSDIVTEFEKRYKNP